MERPTVIVHRSVIELAPLALFAVAFIHVVRCVYTRINRRYHLPPGPTALPLVGNVLSVNSQQPWLTYTAWGEKYGDVLYFQLLDTDVIVLRTYSDVTELLEKRSQIYSDRPLFSTLRLYGHGLNFALAPYGPSWRLCRRICNQTFRTEAAVAFRPMQLRRARELIINIIDDPQEYPTCYSTFAAAVGLSAVYGYDPQLRGDPMVKMVGDFCKASFPGLSFKKATLVKYFPFLLWVPEWVPVLSWISHEASIAHALGIKMVEAPYQWARERIAIKEGIVPETMVFSHIQRMEKLDSPHRAEYETALKSASMTTFLASTEMVGRILVTFTLAMVKNPRVWRHAQKEIDVLTGTARLPEYADRQSLPYVDAIIRETMRWKPVVPMGSPHCVTTDDYYKGYYISSGTMIFANIWAMTHDETRYPNAGMFIPERFLDSIGKLIEDNPADYIFGFGKRKCPGRHTANASLWSAIATMLATLDFNTAKDANGNDIEFEAKFSHGITYYPLKFPCNLVPRTHITREVLQRSIADWSDGVVV